MKNKILVKIIIGDLILSKKIKNGLLTEAKEDFIKIIIRENGVWDNDNICFYPYHKIDRFEFIED